MNERIDTNLVGRVAHLSRLELSAKELEVFSRQLSAIVDYIRKLDELDTSAVEPLAHCLPMSNVFRDDEVLPSLSAQQALANAPDRFEDFFKVPQILEDTSGA
jgi:aspartyl-tRNA(Asn)/glutamyl-tRNA(Gln) amidotransferase subunit C